MVCAVCCVLCAVCCVLCAARVCVLCVCGVWCVGNETDENKVEDVLLSPGPEAGFLACFHIPDPDNICPIARSLIPTLLWNNSQRLIEVIENGIPCGKHFDSRALTAANHLQFVWPTGSIQT